MNTYKVVVAAERVTPLRNTLYVTCPDAGTARAAAMVEMGKEGFTFGVELPASTCDPRILSVEVSPEEPS